MLRWNSLLMSCRTCLARPLVFGRRASGVLLAVLLVAPAANALSITDLVPLFFEGEDGFGFSRAATDAAGLPPQYAATANDDWIAAGAANGLPIQIEQTLGPVYQQPGSPSASDPIIADSTWRIRNLGTEDLIAPLLVFSSVDPSGVYPIAVPLTGLDGRLLELLEYEFAGIDYVFGVTALPDLAVGDVADITVRYVVAGPISGTSLRELPPLGVSVLGSYLIVPEPTTASLFGLGLVAVAFSARRKC